MINPNAVPNDFAAVNKGQVKTIAKAAVAEFDARLPGGAGETLHQLINAWNVPTPGNSDFAAVNLGQLKNLAKPFYDRLIATGWKTEYPWSSPSNPPNDFAMANIGQVKNLFAFDLSAPAAPSAITATVLGDGTVEVTWVNNSQNATRFLIERSSDGQNWTVIGAAGAGATNFLAPVDDSDGLGPQQIKVVPINPAGAGDPSDDPASGGPASYEDPIPVTNYAVIDVSGTSTGGVDVGMIALDDNNKVAFSYSGFGGYIVCKWQNGVVSSNPLPRSMPGPWGFDSLCGPPIFMTGAGAVFGNLAVGEPPFSYSSDGTSCQLITPDAIRPPYSGPENNHCAIYGGCNGGFFGNSGVSPLPWASTWGQFVPSQGHSVFFFDPDNEDAWDAILPPDILTDFVFSPFIPTKMSDNGMVLGASYQSWIPGGIGAMLWDGKSVKDLSRWGGPRDLNNKGQVITSLGYLVENETPRNLTQMAPLRYRNKITNWDPKFISNPNATDGGVYIMNGNGWGILRITGTSATYSGIRLPPWVTDLDCRSINANGVISAAGRIRRANPDGSFSSSERRALLLLPFEIEGYKRGAINSPGAKVPKGTGQFGYETVMLENADFQDNPRFQRDCDSPEVNKTVDDDFVKVVLKWPKDMKVAGVKLQLKHDGMEVDATKTTPETAVTIKGPSRLNFYKPDGTKLTDADLVINDLANPGTGYLAEILTTGELTLFIEGADKFGYLGPDSPTMDNVGAQQTAAKKLGGAILQWQVTQGGTTSTDKLLVYRGGFLLYEQPNGQPGAYGLFTFYDGKGRITNDKTDYGDQLAQWVGKSGKLTGGDCDESGGNGHIPPGWRIVFRRTDFSATQRNKIEGAGANRVIKQGGYCRWVQDDATAAAQRYTTTYEYRANNAHDAAIGEPTTIMFKFQTEVIPPTSAANRSEIQIHPDGKKDGTAGCIGIQDYTDCADVFRVLTNYHGLKLKVETN